MLELKNIKKTYKVGEIETKALNGINVAFREKEFVAILGASGSGKTTCLNIIGGLDRYDGGEMNIKGKNTVNFKDRDWDAYRNNSIGFVFQSYNLITHLSIVANVELGMTLSGVSKSEKRKRAVEVLEQVGLKEHLHKKPNQLSGGQMQRVAIARALANNPEILLCDEPTGALDSDTSRQIMDLIRSVSKDRLVIMVTHNADIAGSYADRIIRFRDGVISDDSNPHEERVKPDAFSLKKTAMNFLTALNLSGNNILTKKGRTFLTAFASSIGIIGIAVILSLSNGFQLQIDKFQEDAMAEFPIIISNSTTDVDRETMRANRADRTSVINAEDDAPPPTEVRIYDPGKYIVTHENKFTDEYIDYINKIDPGICSSIGYMRLVSMNVLRNDGGNPKPINFPTLMSMMSGTASSNGASAISSMANMGLTSFPDTLGDGAGFLERNYELLYGEYPKEPTDLVMIIGKSGRLSTTTLESLGYDVDRESISFEEIVNTELKLIGNNDYYSEIQGGGFEINEENFEAILEQFPMAKAMIPPGISTEEAITVLKSIISATPAEPSDVKSFMPGKDYDKMWDSPDSLTLKITGIVRLSEDSSVGLLSNGIAYGDSLCELIIERSQSSEIVKAQKAQEDSVFPSGMFGTGETLTDEQKADNKKMMLHILGNEAVPYGVMLYPTSFENKDLLIDYLDDWNNGKDLDDQVIYIDLAGTLLGFMSDITNAITIVLIAFAAISLVVSLIMIAIITYVSVLERTKEIGILRALGARKKDITRVFDAETFIIGAFSGILGIAIAYALTFPINVIIENMTNLPNVAKLNILHVIGLFILSTGLTVLGGHLPARMASRKDAVEALRSE